MLSFNFERVIVVIIIWLLRSLLIAEAQIQSDRLSNADRPTECPTHTSWNMGTRLASSSDSFFTLTDPAGRVFFEEKRNSLSNFQRPAARHLGSHHVTRSSFRLFYLFLSNKVPIVCIMFLSPWVSPLPSATFLVAALRITQFSHLVLCALYSRHHC